MLNVLLKRTEMLFLRGVDLTNNPPPFSSGLRTDHGGSSLRYRSEKVSYLPFWLVQVQSVNQIKCKCRACLRRQHVWATLP